MPLSFNALTNTAVYGRFGVFNDTIADISAVSFFNGNVYMKNRLVLNGSVTQVAETIPALTANYTILTTNTSKWLNGEYFVSTSNNSPTDYYAFDKDTSTFVTLLNYSSGVYTGTQSTLNINGEWIQIQTPYGSILQSYYITVPTTTDLPTSWTLLGSPNGTTWVALDNRINQNLTQGSQTTFNVTGASAYFFYRLIVTAVVASSCKITELGITGTGSVATAAPSTAKLYVNGETYVDGVIKINGSPVPTPTPAMTANTTVITGQGENHLNGTYICLTSALTHTTDYQVFDKNPTTFIQLNSYNAFGDYAGAQSTLVEGSAIMGEWVQLKTPVANILTGYSITTVTTNNYKPWEWQVAGSNDGDVWYSLDFQTDQTLQTNAQNNYAIMNAVPYLYYRLIITTIWDGTILQFKEFGLITLDTPSALYVKGKTTVDGNLTVTGSLTLPANSISTTAISGYSTGSGLTIAQILANPNVWTSTNTFNDYLPTSTKTTATDDAQLINKTIGDNLYGGKGSTNAWTGANSFTVLPTCTVSATTGSQFLNKTAGDSLYGSKGSANTWSGTNTFNTFLPTSSKTPTANEELITKVYADNRYLTGSSGLTIAQVVANPNVWTNTNTFNDYLPTSTKIATTDNSQLINKTIGDSLYAAISSLNSYLTTNAATSTYATLSALNSYLTTSAATSTYATLSALNSYLTTSAATSTYATLSALNSYLTRTTADSLYQPKITVYEYRNKTLSVTASSSNTFGYLLLQPYGTVTPAFPPSGRYLVTGSVTSNYTTASGGFKYRFETYNEAYGDTYVNQTVYTGITVNTNSYYNNIIPIMEYVNISGYFDRLDLMVMFGSVPQGVTLTANIILTKM